MANGGRAGHASRNVAADREQQIGTRGESSISHPIGAGHLYANGRKALLDSGIIVRGFLPRYFRGKRAMMNTVLGVIAGGLVGGAAHVFVKANHDTGVLVSMVIGAMGGFLGGKVVAPMLGVFAIADVFSPSLLLLALAGAAACLIIADLLSNRYGV